MTWKRIGGYNFKWGHRVIPDPFHPDKIYVTTFGGSVWYGPAKGDAKAPEDIATPVMLGTVAERDRSAVRRRAQAHSMMTLPERPELMTRNASSKSR